MRATVVSLVCALLALNWYAFTFPIELSPVSVEAVQDRQGAVTVVAEDEQSPVVTDADNDTEMQTRPLFSTTRRPPKPESEAVEADATSATPATSAPIEEQSGLRLVGVMQIGAKERRALIRSADAPNGVWLPVGGEVNGWRVSNIETENVVVVKAGQVEQVALRRREDDRSR